MVGGDTADRTRRSGMMHRAIALPVRRCRDSSTGVVVETDRERADRHERERKEDSERYERERKEERRRADERRKEEREQADRRRKEARERRNHESGGG